MRSDPACRPITAEEFLAIDFGSDRKFELSDGVIQMMTGGSSFDADVAGNIYHALRQKLRGTGCRPYNSDMGLRVDDVNVRYPDIAIYCGKRRDHPSHDAPVFNDPLVIFEVLSPSTLRVDQGVKFAEYRRIPSLEAIVFVDPINRLTRVLTRLPGSEDGWFDPGFGAPHDVILPGLSIALSEAEIFAQD